MLKGALYNPLRLEQSLTKPSPPVTFPAKLHVSSCCCRYREVGKSYCIVGILVKLLNPQ